MNAKWIKQNLGAVIVLAVFVVLLGGAIWLQQQAAARKNQIETDLEQQRAQLQRLLSSKPFPAQENIEVLRRDYDRLSQEYQALTQAVNRSSIQVPELRPVTFSQEMTKTLDRLRRDAQSSHVTIPDNFAFGFSRYVQALPARNLSESDQKQVLGLLYKQLSAIDKLSELLFESRVQEIREIRRVEVEPGGDNPDALAATITNDPNALYQMMPFEIDFGCNTDALRLFLNKLSKADWFFTVRVLRVNSGTAGTSTGGGGTAGGEKTKPTEANKLAITVRVSLVEFPGGTQKPGS